jgi:hypothetical protein
MRKMLSNSKDKMLLLAKNDLLLKTLTQKQNYLECQKCFSTLTKQQPPRNFSLIYNSSRSFSDSKPSSQDKGKSAKSTAQTESDQEPDLKIDPKLQAGFLEEMLVEKPKPNTNYTYNDKTIFSISAKEKALHDHAKYYMMWTGVWGVASYLTFFYIWKYAVIVPIWFLMGAVMGIITSRKFGKSSIKKIELIDPRNVKVQWMWGNENIIRIQEFKFLGIKEIAADPTMNEGSGKNRAMNLVKVNFKDEKQRNYWEVGLLIDPYRTKIPNLDLLKHVIYGNEVEVGKFVYMEGGLDDAQQAQEKSQAKAAADNTDKYKKDRKPGDKAKFEFSEKEMEDLKKEVDKNKK